jgi:hypothetical protein
LIAKLIANTVDNSEQPQTPVDKLAREIGLPDRLSGLTGALAMSMIQY